MSVFVKRQSAGINPNAIIPEPKIADKERSEVWATALTEFRKSSGAAEPNATKVTAARIQKILVNCIKFIATRLSYLQPLQELETV